VSRKPFEASFEAWLPGHSAKRSHLKLYFCPCSAGPLRLLPASRPSEGIPTLFLTWRDFERFKPTRTLRADSVQGAAGFKGDEPAVLTMFLEIPVDKEEFINLGDRFRQTLAITAKVASADKVSPSLLSPSPLRQGVSLSLASLSCHGVSLSLATRCLPLSCIPLL
jgi:hypothetical protein